MGVKKSAISILIFRNLPKRKPVRLEEMCKVREKNVYEISARKAKQSQKGYTDTVNSVYPPRPYKGRV